MNRSLSLALVVAALLAAAAPAPAAARDIQLVAYGTGVTTCHVSLTYTRVYPNFFFPPHSYTGETICSQAIQQTGRAWTGLDSGNQCATFGTTCRSSGSSMGGSSMWYRVTLIAPHGQGWIAPPNECHGAGSDNLDCTFVEELI